MKTAIYIEDGVQQIVLTPENDFEKNIVNSMLQDKYSLQVFSGSFYDCRGGWVKQNTYFKNVYLNNDSNYKSLIIKKDNDPT